MLVLKESELAVHHAPAYLRKGALPLPMHIGKEE
jgi:hypothetical protein